MRTLHLTTPHMHGDDVKHLQSQLEYHKWYDGVLDGEYGLYTAQAVYRAKYWLGYLNPDQVAGDALLHYLLGRRRTPLMLATTKFRMRKQPKPNKPRAANLGERALRNAITYIGEKENPAGSNRIGFASIWYGVIGSWCAMAVTRWYVDTGSKTFKRGKYYAYVPFMVADARAGRNNLTLTKNPQPGDIPCYDWPGESPGTADHTGLFEKWLNRSAGTFSAIEGNTGIGNDSNGGEVMRRERNVSTVQCFIHVGK